MTWKELNSRKDLIQLEKMKKKGILTLISQREINNRRDWFNNSKKKRKMMERKIIMKKIRIMRMMMGMRNFESCDINYNQSKIIPYIIHYNTIILIIYIKGRLIIFITREYLYMSDNL